MEQESPVKAYSGYAHAERPVSFHWQGEEHKVQNIESAWIEPGSRHFTVTTSLGLRFHLTYIQASDAWTVRSLGCSSDMTVDKGTGNK